MSAAPLLGALGWARPEALVALAAPLVFLALLRLLERAPPRVTGTLALWKELAPSHAAGRRARGRVAPWAWITALGLLCAALAWAGPRGARAAPPPPWTLVVDLSPSMGLPAPGDGGTTRLEAALGTAQAWIEAHAEPRAPVRWITAERAPLVLRRGERPPPSWLDPEAGSAPDWSLHDLPGTLWVTDRAPDVPRAAAGLFASGGSAVPGPIAADGARTLVWEGDALRTEERPRALAVRLKEPEGARLPAPLERVLEVWCEARGYALARAPREGTQLVVELAATSDSGEELRCGRDGWRASARGVAAAPPEDDPLAAEDWLVGRAADGAERALVRARPGRIELGFGALSEPEGDSVSFALSWARLLDRCVRPPSDVLALEERLEAGPALALPGRAAPVPQGAGEDSGPYLDAGLALGAALCAALVLVLHRPAVGRSG